MRLAKKSELAQALASCRGAFLSVGVFSAVINILMLTGSIFMLQVYDRVLPSRSVPTLVGLARPRQLSCSASRACSISSARAS